MRILVLLGLLIPSAYALDDKAFSIELQRYDQIIGKLQSQNDRLLGDVRDLQRQNLLLKKALETVQGKADAVADQMARVENVNVRNVEAAQKQLTMMMSTAENNKYDWGGKARDCTDLSVKHQQIKLVTDPNGTKTVKFLCFDGKALHLGTEVHDVAGK